jgi:hypothetical protein
LHFRCTEWLDPVARTRHMAPLLGVWRVTRPRREVDPTPSCTPVGRWATLPTLQGQDRQPNFGFGSVRETQLVDPAWENGEEDRRSPIQVRHRLGLGNEEPVPRKKTLKIFALQPPNGRLSCSHNPLVVGSNPTRPTIPRTDVALLF